MKKHQVRYKKEHIGKIKIINDFLPQPKDLILRKKPLDLTESRVN